jgi:hypothetical protein
MDDNVLDVRKQTGLSWDPSFTQNRRLHQYVILPRSSFQKSQNSAVLCSTTRRHIHIAKTIASCAVDLQ